MPLKDKDIIKQLNDLVQEPDFTELNKLLQSKFNLFQLLDIEIKEIYYSKILGWLLNPQANHKLGDWFLREFLKHLINNEDRLNYFKKMQIEYIDIDCISLDNVKISIEQTILSKRRLDIFIQILSLEDDENWILVIENKINSIESPNQTKFYSEELYEKYPDTMIKKICVFLTPSGSEPSSKKFIPCKWSEVRNILIDLLGNLNISNEIKYFLNQFKSSIEVFVMENPDLERLYLKLFQKYSDVFEFLFTKYSEYRSTPYHKYTEMVEEKLKEKLDEVNWNFERGKGWNILGKKKWLEIQTRNNWGKSKYSIITTIETKIENDDIIKIYIYSQSKLSIKLLKIYKKKIENSIKNPVRKKSYYDQFFNNFNPSQFALFNYKIIDNFDEIGIEDASTLVADKLGEIIQEYEGIFDNAIIDLEKEYD